MSVGIICEYNPFHNGHLHQINEIKKESSEPIICVMSGNFTQRGSLAVVDKYERARTAVLCGANVVLELPFPYCSGSAEFFASAGVSVLASCGVDKLSFGSECADIETLSKFARLALSEEFARAYAESAKAGGNARAYFETLRSLSGDRIEPLSNDILAIEYIKAIIKNGHDITPCPIKREGADYNVTKLSLGENPSASAIRESLFGKDADKITDFVPEASCNMLNGADLASFEKAERAILLALRLFDDSADVAVRDVGLVNRIASSAKESRSFAELFDKVKCKKYTDSAIRRAILYMILGVSEEDLSSIPAYTCLLAADSVGREELSRLRKKQMDIPIVTKPSDACELGGARVKRQAELSARADALYTLCFSEPKENAEYVRKSPAII